MEEYLKQKYKDKTHLNIFGREVPCWKFVLDSYESKESPILNKKLEKELKKSKEPKKISWLWLTLSPDKWLRNMDVTQQNINAVHQWCENWFNHNPKYYHGFTYVLEGGSENKHLHVHAILNMKNSHRHAEYIKKSWNRHFPNNQLLTSVDANSEAYQNGKAKGEYCYKRFDDPLYLQERLDYLENEKKGCHENLVDLGVRGSGGFLTDII